ncbi:Hypothetical predicted protein [Lecanosticta acicola]|uniref:Glutathione S-transferase n=1 Tax=Lecanosticta acicola TaxID=111012 RepID=A0AAI8YV29_9PEZI|nr:Hypothetical predicted protein [Lecanosticta acicola]
MADSEHITYHFATMFPSLIPDSHRDQIVALLDEIHKLPFFTLSFGGHKAVVSPRGALTRMREMLDGNEISERHRKLLQAKWDMANKVDLNAKLTPEAIRDAEVTHKKFFDRICGYLPGNGDGPWMFGLQQPSAFDAHLVPVLVRLQDVGRGALLPGSLAEYAERAKKTREWQSVMNGLRTTMYMG